jgi:hypothetical protein
MLEKREKFLLIFLLLVTIFSFIGLSINSCSFISLLKNGNSETEAAVQLQSTGQNQEDSEQQNTTKNQVELQNKETAQNQWESSNQDSALAKSEETAQSQEEAQDQNNYQSEEDKNSENQDTEQSSNSYNEPEGSTLEIVEDPTNIVNNTDTSAEKPENGIPSSPEVKLEIILGPEYAQDNQVCYWRIRATVSGNPIPEIKFSKDDSNGSWGSNIAQVNLTEGQSYTLICDVKNLEGSVSSSLTLNWVENPAGSGSDQSQSQQNSQSDIQVDYQDVGSFKIDVNLTTQQVIVYYKDSVIKSMICSGGLPESPTPLGSFMTYQKIYYAWIPKFDQGAYYWTRFYGPYLFHSVPFNKEGNMLVEEYAKLGSPASHGCVRLELEDAKWLYEVLPLGIGVIIHN